MGNVLISVITTVYNVEEWIKRTIDSILKQTLQDIELILIDDYSPDNSVAIIKQFNDTRIKFIQNTANLGPGVSRQIGLQNASGEYIIFVDGDDWLELDCLENLYNVAKEGYDIVSCKTIQHNDYGIVKNKKNRWNMDQRRFFKFFK